ncbi:hypothetical protein RCL1_006163 [Eukaryota sp. TZLM3-RCL]
MTVTKRLKIITLGDPSVGKSTLVKRFCENRFVSKYLATIGVDYGVKPVTLPSNNSARVSFFDFSGLSDFLEVRNEFYSDSHGAILVFDVTNRSSFENLRNWIIEARRYDAPSSLIIHVCANKVDKPPRTVSEDEARSFCQTERVSYFETSACTGSGVKECFISLFSKIYEQIP